MNSELRSLRAEVSDLRDEVETLRSELSKVRRTVADIRLGGFGGRDPIRETSEGSEDSYSVVSEYPASSCAAGVATGVATSGSVVNRAPSPQSSAATPPCVLTWREREEIADQIGNFIARSVAGLHRGQSGRDKVPLPSRLWVVIRDYAGQIYSPVKVVRSWSSAKLLVKKGADCGDSIFIGFASEREGRRSIAVAGLSWPQVIEA